MVQFMVSKTSKGNYYQRKTKIWFEKEGYVVYPMEFAKSIFTPKGMIYIKKDIAGADLMCMNGKEVIFIQSKTNLVDIGRGVKELNKHPYPKCACLKKIVVRWEPREKQPTIYDA